MTSLKGNRDFPEGFLWGAATAAHQVEGSNVNSDWWSFEHDPSSAAVESSGDGIDHFTRYDEDFALLASLGHNAHRFSIEWSRIEPAPGEFSAAAIAHYRRVLLSIRAHGMTPFVTLHHFTLPQWFAEQGGWVSPFALDRFESFVRYAVTGLGDLLEQVCTINEPQMVALHGYLEGYHPPGKTNPTLWKRVGRILLDAHFLAVRLVRELTSARVGLVVQLPYLVPAREDSATVAFRDALQAEIVDLYIDGLAGSPADAGDWLGVQYYRKNWVDPSSPTLFAAPPPGVPTTQMGWAVFPEGLRLVLHRASDAGLPIYITENGIATEDDTERIAYLEGHLRAVATAMSEGVDVRGYLHWSAFDNFEWSEGYRPKFGLISVDRNNGHAREPKPSAVRFAEIARTGSWKPS